MRVILGGLQKSTLQDYPDKIACIIFTKGCNFKCGYCHNPELFDSKSPTIELSEILDFLKTRVNKLDGVVITGGEPTLHQDLPKFIKEIKNLGFCVKLDTNGTNYTMLKTLINEKLIDYVAMDIKSPIEKYNKITNSKVDINEVKKSIELLKSDVIDYEFRTTIVKSQLNIDDFKIIAQEIKGAKKYFLQKFEPSKTLDKNFMQEKSYNDDELKPFIELLKKEIEYVEIR